MIVYLVKIFMTITTKSLNKEIAFKVFNVTMWIKNLLFKNFKKTFRSLHNMLCSYVIVSSSKRLYVLEKHLTRARKKELLKKITQISKTINNKYLTNNNHNLNILSKLINVVFNILQVSLLKKKFNAP